MEVAGRGREFQSQNLGKKSRVTRSKHAPGNSYRKNQRNYSGSLSQFGRYNAMERTNSVIKSVGLAKSRGMV